jgi:hypothetical protein
VGPRTGLDDVERRKILSLPGVELRPLGRPARCQSLYRLSYPGSQLNLRKKEAYGNSAAQYSESKKRIISFSPGSADINIPLPRQRTVWLHGSHMQFGSHLGLYTL